MSSVSASVSPSRSPSASISPSVSASVSPSKSPSASPSRSPSASISPSYSPSLSPSKSPSLSPSPSASPSTPPVSDFALARESIEEIPDFNVIISEFENGSEQRRLRHARPVGSFKITTPVLTKDQMLAYRNYFTNHYGALNSFTFTSPFDNVQYTVRFEPGSFSNKYEGGCFQCSFQLKVLSC